MGYAHCLSCSKGDPPLWMLLAFVNGWLPGSSGSMRAWSRTGRFGRPPSITVRILFLITNVAAVFREDTLRLVRPFFRYSYLRSVSSKRRKAASAEIRLLARHTPIGQLLDLDRHAGHRANYMIAFAQDLKVGIEIADLRLAAARQEGFMPVHGQSIRPADPVRTMTLARPHGVFAALGGDGLAPLAWAAISPSWNSMRRSCPGLTCECGMQGSAHLVADKRIAALQDGFVGKRGQKLGARGKRGAAQLEARRRSRRSRCRGDRPGAPARRYGHASGLGVKPADAFSKSRRCSKVFLLSAALAAFPICCRSAGGPAPGCRQGAEGRAPRRGLCVRLPSISRLRPRSWRADSEATWPGVRRAPERRVRRRR